MGPDDLSLPGRGRVPFLPTSWVEVLGLARLARGLFEGLYRTRELP